jgi:titin
MELDDPDQKREFETDPESTHYWDLTGKIGSVYDYFVVAVNGLGPSFHSVIKTGRIISYPMPPEDLDGRSGDSFVELKWSSPRDDGGSDLTAFNIYRRTMETDFTLIDWNLPNVLSFNDSSVENGVEYQYRITAANEIGDSDPTPILNFIPSTLPSSPVCLEAHLVKNWIELTWQPPLDDGGADITTYSIYRTTGSGVQEKVAEVSEPDRRYSDDDITMGQGYSYHITATNLRGESGPSDLVDIIPLSTSSPPGSLYLEQKDGTVRLSWNVPKANGGSNPHRYNIYRGSNGSDPEYFDSVNGLFTEYVDEDVTPGYELSYQVSAVNDVGESQLSGKVSCLVHSPPSAPVLILVTQQDGHIILEWIVPENDGGSEIMEYIIKRKVFNGTPVVVGTSGPSTMELIDNDVVKGMTYSYMVEARNQRGVSIPSNMVNITMMGVPDRPENISANIEADRVILKWKPSQNDGGSPIIIYKIFRRMVDNEWDMVSTITSDKLELADTDVVSGRSYEYCIVATNQQGDSEPSETFIVEFPQKEKNSISKLIALCGVLAAVIGTAIGILIFVGGRPRIEGSSVQPDIGPYDHHLDEQ